MTVVAKVGTLIAVVLLGSVAAGCGGASNPRTGGPMSDTLTMSDTNFTNPSGSGLTLGSSFAGTFLSATAGESVSFQSYADASNTINGKGATSGLHTATLAKCPKQRCARAGGGGPCTWGPGA